MQATPYEEHEHTENGNSQRDVIRLYDLGQELVFDSNIDPLHILLRDMQTQVVIARYAYGLVYGNDEDFGLQAYDFSVSPRHNYLIVKEIQLGPSIDILYAKLYCLKPLPANDFTHNHHVSNNTKRTFESFQFLSFLFSHDQHESTLWVHGEQIDHLTTIDEYKYAHCDVRLSSEEDGPQNDKGAVFKIHASYPAVALEEGLRDRKYQMNLHPAQVVNSLEKITAQSDSELCELYTRGLEALYAPAALGLELGLGISAENTQTKQTAWLCHSLIGSRILNLDVEAISLELKRLGFICHNLLPQDLPSQNSDQNQAKPLARVLAYAPLANQTLFTTHSIALVNKLAQQHHIVYDGFQVCTVNSNALGPSTSSPNALSSNTWPVQPTWQQAITLSFKLYKQLGNLLVKQQLSSMLFTKHFERLSKKHQIHGIADLFSPQQNKAIGEVRAALSQFNDYELSDAELTQAVNDALLGQH
ncbi:hypothetical protein [uncultured Paraglaciecola sp.]|uniref:hypothetical protein n=1 Tax=uncultured Paraglaciecola sp. TaxID=1765024 RepID=UPI00259354E9|nr:hypothetical protein [uncultured Paraglaciecola sp.]